MHAAVTSSFARAAERAHVSPPAVSKAIRKLEEDFGAQLFERTTRKVRLTPAGVVALARCQRALTELDGLGAELAASDGRPDGPLRIAAMEVFSIELLPAALVGLVAEHPGVIPICSETIPQRMTERLIAGEIDVAFTIGATRAPGIELHPLGESRGVLVCGKGHPLFAQGRVSPKQLQHYPFVVPRFFGADHLPSLDQFPDDRYPRKTGATIELLQMGVALVVDGPYLGYFPQISVHKHLATKRLRALRGISGEPFLLQAMGRAGVPFRPAARLLIERLRLAVATIGRRSK